MNIETNKTFWTVPELSKAIGKHRATIISWIKTGKLKTRRVGIEYRIYKSDWNEFLADCNSGQLVEL